MVVAKAVEKPVERQKCEFPLFGVVVFQGLRLNLVKRDEDVADLVVGTIRRETENVGRAIDIRSTIQFPYFIVADKNDAENDFVLSLRYL